MTADIGHFSNQANIQSNALLFIWTQEGNMHET